MIRAVFFDAAGTLFHLPRGVGYHYAEVAGRHGVTIPAADLDRAFFAVWKEMPLRAAGLEPRTDDDKGWWRELVSRVLTRCGAPREAMDGEAYYEELYAEFTRPGIWELFPEVRDVLDTLRPRYQLGIISNFDGRLRAILSHLGIAESFSHVTISSEIGVDKPHPRIFQTAVGGMDLVADEAIHVGDDAVRDWQGAASAGLHIFRLDRPHNSLKDLLAAL